MALNDFQSHLNQIIEQIEENDKIEQNKRLAQQRFLINKMKINLSQIIRIKRFDELKQLKRFCISSDKSYDSLKSIPKLLLPQTKTNLYFDLEDGFTQCFDNQRLITDYCDYRLRKWIYFLRCLDENQLISKEKPNFVSFGGPIADIMSTAYDSGIHWKVSAQMFSGVIYLLKSRAEPRFDPIYGEVNIQSFCGLKFLHLVTDRKDNEINEFEKFFVINSFKLDTHKVLTLNEIDAIDQSGKPVDVKVVQIVRTSKSQEFFNGKKLLQCWCKASIGGIHKLIFGNRNSDNYLIDIEEREVSKIAEMCSAYWSDKKCIEFLGRLFDFMKECITEEMIIYEFTLNRGEEYVSCYRINPNNSEQILPEFYTSK